MSETEPAFDAIDLEPLDRQSRYKLFMGSIVPRPIAVVTTLSDAGVVNAAPFSNFMALSTEGSLLAFSVGAEPRSFDRCKDTLRNIHANGEFVINFMSDERARDIQNISRWRPPDVSEIAEVGWSLIASQLVLAPRVREAVIQIECKLHSITDFGESRLVAGKALRFHAREGVIKDCKIDLAKYRPLGRLSGRLYCKLGELIDGASSSE